MMKASLFDEDDDEDEDCEDMITEDISLKKSRPVILEPRTTALEPRDKFIEEIAHSMLTGSVSKGLGGNMSITNNLTSSLLRSQFMAASHSPSITKQPPKAASGTSSLNYSLTGGYEKFVTLSTSSGLERPRTVVPRYLDKVPLKESILSGKFKCYSDSGLFMNRSFRCGWAADWRIANIGDDLDPTSSFERTKGPFGITLERLKINNNDEQGWDAPSSPDFSST